jgi:asparagine synthetase B (glutamine-hydrolysing)
MCGIHASISTRGFQIPSPGLKHLLCKRGPDHVGELQAEIQDDGLTYYLSFTSTVLALRGGHVTAQPFIDPQSGSVLCWNGEAWKIGPETVAGNDGRKVFDALLGASTTQGIGSESTSKVVEALNSISGPFAFVFFDNIHKQLFFGRDRLGRRSLLYNSLDDSKSIEFSSTADPARGLWKEVEADAIYVLSCRKEDAGKEVQCLDPGLILASRLPLHRYAWGFSGQALQSASRDMMEISSV